MAEHESKTNDLGSSDDYITVPQMLKKHESNADSTKLTLLLTAAYEAAVRASDEDARRFTDPLQVDVKGQSLRLCKKFSRGSVKVHVHQEDGDAALDAYAAKAAEGRQTQRRWGSGIDQGFGGRG